jgi:hypothetical protein
MALQFENTGILYLLIPLFQIMILALMCDYLFPFSVPVNVLTVAVALYICKLIDKRGWFPIVFHVAIAGIFIFYFSGGAYFVIFMTSYLILSLKKPDRRLIINTLLIIGITFLVPYVAWKFIFLAPLKQAYFRSTPDVAAMLRYSRPLLFQVTLVGIPVIFLMSRISTMNFQKIKIKKPVGKPLANKGKQNTTVSVSRRFDIKKSGLPIGIAAIIAASGFVLYESYNKKERSKAEIEYLAYHGDWQKVIQLCEANPNYNRMVNYQYNRALLHSGLMLDKLFCFEQLLGVQGLFVDKPFTSEVALPNSDLYFDLGNIDDAQRFAFESQTLMPNSPRVLKRLILDCIIFKNTDAANTYINILSKNPMEKSWVEKYKAYVSDLSLSDSDPEIAAKRMDMIKTEGIVITPHEKLVSLLQKNPKNKQAFEYLIAFDLMEHDLTSFIEDMNFINEQHYQKLPTVIEEALVLFRSQRPNLEFLFRFNISKETTQRFREFAKLTSANRGDREKAKLATANYKNTYWYYVLFLSPVVTKAKLETHPLDANY